MTLEYAKIVGTNTVLFETWNGSHDIGFDLSYRDTNNHGANGGFALKLDTQPKNLSFSGIILESSLADLEAMEGEAITLTIYNQDLTGMTFKLKQVNKIRGIDISSTSTAGVVATTYTKHEMQLTIMRET